MISGIYWSAGSRDVNEDCVAFEDVLTEKGNCTLIAVCDGIGSLAHAGTASGYAAECLVKWFYSEGIRLAGSTRSHIRRSICRCIYDCHSDMARTAAGAGIRWGCSCTCVVVRESRYMCVHLGDGAAYLIRPGRTLQRLTGSHENRRRELVKGIVSTDYHMPDICFGTIRKGWGILVASNGFISCHSERELGGYLTFDGIITDERIDRRLAGIGAETARRGERDERSAVYAIRR